MTFSIFFFKLLNRFLFILQRFSICYTLSQDIVNPYIAKVVNIYKYLQVRTIFIQKYEHILFWNALSSLSCFNTLQNI